MSANVYVIEDYENETALRSQKNKPKQTQSQRSAFCKNAKKNGIIQPRGFYLSVKFATLLKQEFICVSSF